MSAAVYLKAVCHPERAHCATGLCNPCYQRYKKIVKVGGTFPKDARTLHKIVLAHEDRKTEKMNLLRAERQERVRQRQEYYSVDERYRRRRDSVLRARYGITLAEYEERLAAQGGGCAVCGGKPLTKVPLAVDHRHDNGFIRGILCYRCSSFVAAFDASPELLVKLRTYARCGAGISDNGYREGNASRSPRKPPAFSNTADRSEA